MDDRTQGLSRRQLALLGLSLPLVPAFGGCRTTTGAALSAVDPDAAAAASYDCLVLGGGIAGLTAAWQLNQWWGGRGKILLIEGANRLGGRLQTLHDWLPGPVELGAEFIHRPPGSVRLWTYVDGFGLQTRVIPKFAESRIFYPQNFRPAFANGLRPVAAALMWNAIQAATMFSKINDYQGPDMAAGEWIERHYDTLLDLDRGLGEDFVAMALTGHLPGTLRDLSIRGFASDHISTQLEERNEYYVSAGYDALVKAFARDLTILPSTRVTRISYADNWIEVAAGGRRFSARRAICAFSPAMLASGEVEFSPGLPVAKKEALNIIKLGFHTKVILPFKQRFWPSSMAMAHNPWRGRKAGTTYFVLFYGDDQMPPTLSALILGDDAERIDRMTLDDAARTICADLDSMFTDAGSTYDLLRQSTEGGPAVVRKSWKQDEFAKGGISYLSTAPSEFVDVTQARMSLARSDLTPGLHWAGESTAFETQPGSVHGAAESGIRAATEVYLALRDVATRSP